ncbi:unnamed protein product [Paramecium sonneborni]|uniref:Uncharacterized protein n=1 Tax=Paramecium sonneborni TaxID=65129 RepID=A0A8S1QSI6_9CILI|nr:unnamed protein product [Paramecium sonneborni]
MFQPKMIENQKDFQCRFQHSQPIEFVILDQSLPNNQQLICKNCQKNSQLDLRIVEFQILKSNFDDLQRQKIEQYALIINPHIDSVNKFQNTLKSLKTKLIQQLDQLIWLSEDWINTLANSIVSYSFFDELNKVLQQQSSIMDFNKLIENVKIIHKNWKMKVNQRLDEFKIQCENQSFQDIFQQLDNLTFQQEAEVKFQPIIKIKDSYILSFKEQKNLDQWKEGTNRLKVFAWNQNKKKSYYEELEIRYTKDKEILYIKDGSIIRTDKIEDFTKQPELINNLDQIQLLQFKGKYGKNNQKVGRWKVQWDGQTLDDVGGEYQEDGKKSGYWKEPIKNFWRKAMVYEAGNYDNDQKVGTWKFIYRNKQIGGGDYNLQSMKQGKWIEIAENFSSFCQVTYNGEYNLKSMKVGKWDIVVKGKQIGGGQYNQEERQIKIGKWKELDMGFSKDKQVIFDGEYNMKGIKVGQWNILAWGKQIGGGSYDQNEKKIGRWVELDERFDSNKEVTQSGEYNINGMKVGKWDILYKGRYDGKYQKIGGGSYGEAQVKIGKWIDLDENFEFDKQITYNGEYNMQGLKIDRWDIWFKGRYDGKYQKIGGGSYGEAQVKIGKWIDLDENFEFDKQITHNGEYNMQGMKVGRWDIWFNEGNDKQYQLIGGGSYDQNSKKIGSWIELDEGFNEHYQMTQNGEYNIQGMKFGTWVQMDIKCNEKLYEKTYDN